MHILFVYATLFAAAAAAADTKPQQQQQQRKKMLFKRSNNNNNKQQQHQQQHGSAAAATKISRTTQPNAEIYCVFRRFSEIFWTLKLFIAVISIAVATFVGRAPLGPSACLFGQHFESPLEPNKCALHKLCQQHGQHEQQQQQQRQRATWTWQCAMHFALFVVRAH